MTKNKLATLILLILIFFGGFLRFYKLHTLTTYLTDQAIELNDTLEISRGDLKFVGIKTSLSDARNGAVMYYLLLPFLLLFKYNPVAGGVLQGLLSTLTIPVAFILGKKIKDESVGLISASFIALSPLLVTYSRQTQLAYYPLFFSGISLLLIFYFIKKRETKTCFFLGVLLGFMIQIHYLTITLVLLAFLSILFLKKNKLVFLSVTACGIFVGLLPIILFELKNHFFNTRMFLAYFSSHHSSANRLMALNYFPDLFAKMFGGNIQFLGTIILILIIVFLAIKMKSGTNIFEKILLIHIVLSLGLILVLNGNLEPHYLLPSFLSLILLISSTIAFLLKKLKFLLIPSILVSVLLFIINLPAYRLFQNNGANMSPGWNLSAVEKASNLVINDVSEQPFNVAMIVDAQNQGYPIRYFLAVAGKKPLPDYAYDKAQYLYVVVEPKLDFENALHSIYELSSFGGTKIEKQWEIQNGYQLIKLSKNTST